MPPWAHTLINRPAALLQCGKNSTPLGAARLPRKGISPFSTKTKSLHATHREPSYYDILNVPMTATTAEIKKSFYALSLRHHPDRNPSDPTASSRFAKISSAYHVLSNSSKRALYDRDHAITGLTGSRMNPSSTHSTASPGQNPMGSHSSYSYAGSRPASGLSKRRGPFRGPPPSFYAHGGYGATGRTSASTGTDAGAGAGAPGGAAGGADFGDAEAFVDQNPVSHFNARSHFRTQAAEDARRKLRRSREMRRASARVGDYEGGGDLAMRFIVVCGILLTAVGTAAVLKSPALPTGAAAESKSSTSSADRTGQRRKE